MSSDSIAGQNDNDSQMRARHSSDIVALSCLWPIEEPCRWWMDSKLSSRRN